MGMAQSGVRARLILVMVFVLAVSGWTARPWAAKGMETASIRLEQNATDEDLEIVIEAKGQDEGLAELLVTAPDGRTVIDFKAPDPSTLGMRQFRFESPEPEAEPLLAAYPEGVYRFSGRSASGLQLVGEARLVHQLPATTAFMTPEPEAEEVAFESLRISWAAVEGVAAYVLELEQEEQEMSLTVRLPASATSFAVSKGILAPGLEYHLGIGTITHEGNIAIIETTFTTAE